MFSRAEIEHHDFTAVPVDRDIYLMDEKWIPEYEAYIDAIYAGNHPDPPGFISYASVRSIATDHLEISWYPNIHDRYHELLLRLPHCDFIVCVECRDIDEKPRIFVRSEWLDDLHRRPYSAFALVDAIGVKNALRAGNLAESRLVALRGALDEIAARQTQIAIFSFADSVLIKSHWTVGAFDTPVDYTYTPEMMIDLVEEVFSAFKIHLSLDCYACITQGFNEYSDGAIVHTSPSGHHISLNSLGLPFAQLLSIDHATHQAIRTGRHAAAELYLDQLYYRSLRWQYGFDRDGQPAGEYDAPLSHHPGQYYCLSLDLVRANLKGPEGREDLAAG
ncbi:hypothetical protein [Arenimonas donghaensis]|uniref:Uncharacterized protein n=1 Tax=Arenimonas donghaensis DSM 18148 = HO3-R19 TaxID=1121014 RepID=A0A087MLX3_9GAMM|nr:hypothetical protein [Arenimonas donghaensis]KFL37876.1 hypothetical protein N788_01525 [Arenimonas donghaensis DSM 18148 = HO3-R19]